MCFDLDFQRNKISKKRYSFTNPLSTRRKYDLSKHEVVESLESMMISLSFLFLSGIYRKKR